MTDAPSCGNCKWFHIAEKSDDGVCRHDIPVSLSMYVRDRMWIGDGKGCPTYTPKEQPK